MSPRLTYPEEIDLEMKELKHRETRVEIQAANNNRENSRKVEKIWDTGHISAYRAAYIKTHEVDR